MNIHNGKRRAVETFLSPASRNSATWKRFDVGKRWERLKRFHVKTCQKRFRVARRGNVCQTFPRRVENLVARGDSAGYYYYYYYYYY